MRIAITSRIFEPEPSAASFRLGTLANALANAGHQTTVLTVRPPSRLAEGVKTVDAGRRYRVRRFPVLRDRSGYVRGYLQYMSFDIPLFFRLLFGRKQDMVIVEPPPTTGFFVRCVCALRRTPYAYYAADIWSDASSQTGAPAWIVAIVKKLEVFALSGAKLVFSVSDGVTERLGELNVGERVHTVGNGIDLQHFDVGMAPDSPELEFIYAGTASEWHGAGVFVEALPSVLKEFPGARIRFIGGGSERDQMQQRAQELGVSESVSFEPVVAPKELAALFTRAVAALASVRPGSGYDFAFPTKLYSSAACGVPMIYAGIGPGAEFMKTPVDGRPIGIETPFDPEGVAEAMKKTLSEVASTSSADRLQRRRSVAEWAKQNVSLQSVVSRIVAQVEQAEK